MNKFVRITALFLTALVVFSACKNSVDVEEESTTVSESVIETTIENNEITIVDEGLMELLEGVEEEEFFFDEEDYGLHPGSEDMTLSEGGDRIYINNQLFLYVVYGTELSEIESLVAEYDSEIVGYYADLNMYQLKMAEHYEISELEIIAEEISELDFVDLAFVDEISSDGTDVVFDDPWNDNGNGTADWDYVPEGNNWWLEAIHAPEAWEYLDQMTPVRVGVMECFVNSSGHEDLPDFSLIFEGSSLNCDVGDSNHSYNVASIICARPNNGIGISGVCAIPGTELYMASCGDRNVQLSESLRCISRLVCDYGVKVINISRRSESPLVILAASQGNARAIELIENKAKIAEKALTKLIERGNEFVIVMSAGNNNNYGAYKFDAMPYGFEPIGVVPFAKLYRGSDARYNHYLNAIDSELVRSRIIVVGNIGLRSDTESYDDRSEAINDYYVINSSSNRGSRVDILAPGTHIYGCYATGYGYYTGTSQAAPMVAGVAAMLFASNGNLSGSDVKQLIVDNSYRDINYETNIGILRADWAVAAAVGSSSYGSDNNGSMGVLDSAYYSDFETTLNTHQEDWEAYEYDEEVNNIFRVYIYVFGDGDYEDYSYSLELHYYYGEVTPRFVSYEGGDWPDTVLLANGASTGMTYEELREIMPDLPPPYYDPSLNQDVVTCYLDEYDAYVSFFFAEDGTVVNATIVANNFD